MSNLDDQSFFLEERQVLNDPELHLGEASRTRTIKTKIKILKVNVEMYLLSFGVSFKGYVYSVIIYLVAL